MLGVVVYSAVLLTVTGKIILETGSITIINIVGIVLSLLLWMIYGKLNTNEVPLYGSIYYIVKPIDISQTNFFIHLFYQFHEMFRIIGTLNFFLIIFLTAGIALMRDFSYKYFKRLLSLKKYYMVQENAYKKSREEILDNFPEEEYEFLGLDKVLKTNIKFKPDIKKKFSNFKKITGEDFKNYTGFGFSQSDGQENIISNFSKNLKKKN
jgi:magnesium-transporting ATPase (P-type)